MAAYCLRVRLRFPELLEERGWTPWRLFKQSQGRLSLSTAYRLVRLRGRLKNFDAGLLEVLCDVLNLKSLDDLFERDARQRARGK